MPINPHRTAPHPHLREMQTLSKSGFTVELANGATGTLTAPNFVATYPLWTDDGVRVRGSELSAFEAGIIAPSTTLATSDVVILSILHQGEDYLTAVHSRDIGIGWQKRGATTARVVLARGGNPTLYASADATFVHARGLASYTKGSAVYTIRSDYVLASGYDVSWTKINDVLHAAVAGSGAIAIGAPWYVSVVVYRTTPTLAETVTFGALGYAHRRGGK
jgi:hypothetical protein